jgi:hypothetical protein
MRKIRPCDCGDQFTANQLEEQGIGRNDDSIILQPSVVIITRGHTTMKIPMSLFKMFAEWYLTEQEIDDKK